jgi:hypothetical protein
MRKHVFGWSWIAFGLVSTLGCALVANPAPTGSATRRAWVDQTYAQSPADNPLKGFVPFGKSQTTFPHSLEWNYFAWNDLQTDYDRFDWTPIDTFLRDAAACGHQVAFRIYADYPDQPYAVPGFLSSVPKQSYADFSNGIR